METTLSILVVCSAATLPHKCAHAAAFGRLCSAGVHAQVQAKVRWPLHMPQVADMRIAAAGLANLLPVRCGYGPWPIAATGRMQKGWKKVGFEGVCVCVCICVYI